MAGPETLPLVPGVHALVLKDNSSLLGEVIAPTLRRRSKPTGKVPHCSRRESLRPNDANLACAQLQASVKFLDEVRRGPIPFDNSSKTSMTRKSASLMA